jgi:hypothetical protein
MPKVVPTVLCAILLASGQPLRADDSIYERDPINYATAQANDPVTKLSQKLEAGQLKLAYDADHGYLPALLKALDVPISSQSLVFSKTSFQRDLINPQRPRALYFNDDVYIGYVPGGEVVEISSTDPQNGPMFYTLRQKRAGGPSLLRQTDACLQCHASAMTNDLPGHIIRSVYSDPDGQPILSAGTFRTNPTSPFKQRWGGWYVTGTSGSMHHMGNVVARDKDDAESIDFAAGCNLTSLAGRVDTTPYLSPHSDIVALTVLEHQTYIHNLITRASYLTRLAMHDCAELNKALGRPVDYRSESTISRIKNAVEPLLKGMLCSEELALTEPIVGTGDFTKGVRGARPTRQPRALAPRPRPQNAHVQVPVQLPDLQPILRRPAGGGKIRVLPTPARGAEQPGPIERVRTPLG